MRELVLALLATSLVACSTFSTFGAEYVGCCTNGECKGFDSYMEMRSCEARQTIRTMPTIADPQDYKEVFRETRRTYDKYEDKTTLTGPQSFDYWRNAADLSGTSYLLQVQVDGKDIEDVRAVTLIVSGVSSETPFSIEAWSKGEEFPAEIVYTEASDETVAIPLTRDQLAEMTKSGFEVKLADNTSGHVEIPAAYFPAFADKLKEAEKQ